MIAYKIENILKGCSVISSPTHRYLPWSVSRLIRFHHLLFLFLEGTDNVMHDIINNDLLNHVCHHNPLAEMTKSTYI